MVGGHVKFSFDKMDNAKTKNKLISTFFQAPDQMWNHSLFWVAGHQAATTCITNLILSRFQVVHVVVVKNLSWYCCGGLWSDEYVVVWEIVGLGDVNRWLRLGWTWLTTRVCVLFSIDGYGDRDRFQIVQQCLWTSVGHGQPNRWRDCPYFILVPTTKSLR